jgi:hypothetical protein
MQLKLYKTVLQKLISLPDEYLPLVNAFLSSLKQKAEQKKNNREEILKFAGSWNDMSDEDFDDYLKEAKNTGAQMFGREIDL